MTYNSMETSAHDGAPIEGFFFTGPANAFRYTNAQRDVVINSSTFTAAEISRAGIRAGTADDDGLELEVTLPVKLPLVQQYAFAASPPDLTLTLYRYHEDSNPATEWVVVWQGPVTSFSVSGKDAKLRIPSVFESAMRGSVPSVYYQNPCNHVLFDQRCKVSRVANMVTTTITSISPDGLTIGVVTDGFADSYLKAGAIYAPARGERRLILDNVSNVLSVNFPFFNLQLGDTVELDSGCDHAYQGHCKTKYNNTINFGGHPYVPTENPFQGSL